MDFNRIIFPAPKPSYTPENLEGLIWVPRTRFFSMKSLVKSMDSYDCYRNDSTNENVHKNDKQHIPCHYQRLGNGHKHLILFFHGNAEDIGYAAHFTSKLAVGLKADVLSVEYPGYGVYEGEPNAKTILEDAEIVYDFLTAEMDIKPQNIILFGRSIGSGPATHLAANRTPGGLILMSPYTSIKSVVKDIAGSLVSALFAERFNNIGEIERVACPSMFIHGKKDRVISWDHSENLYLKCKAAASLHIADEMTHNSFRFTADILTPIRKFLKKNGFKMKKETIGFPEYVHWMPSHKHTPRRSMSFSARVIDSIVYDM